MHERPGLAIGVAVKPLHLRVTRAIRWLRQTNRRRAKTHVGPYTVLFFVGLTLGVAALSMWLEDRYHDAEAAYRLYITQHPLKPGEKPPRVDWLTGKIWR
jgi:hypothetical protein